MLTLDVNCTRTRWFHGGRADVLASRRSATFCAPTTDDETEHEAGDDDATDDGDRDEVKASVETVGVVIMSRRCCGRHVLGTAVNCSGHRCQSPSYDTSLLTTYSQNIIIIIDHHHHQNVNFPMQKSDTPNKTSCLFFFFFVFSNAIMPLIQYHYFFFSYACHLP